MNTAANEHLSQQTPLLTFTSANIKTPLLMITSHTVEGHFLTILKWAKRNSGRLVCSRCKMLKK